jgi:hypothetical protein
MGLSMKNGGSDRVKKKKKNVRERTPALKTIQEVSTDDLKT